MMAAILAELQIRRGRSFHVSLSSLRISAKRIFTIFQNLKIRTGGRAATQPVLPPQHRRARPTPALSAAVSFVRRCISPISSILPLLLLPLLLLVQSFVQ